MTMETTDFVEQLDRLLAGFSGENELSVGPHMLAHGVEEARDHITALQARVSKLEAKLKAVVPLVDAAYGLSFGTDWNGGTHAKLHGYRRKLIRALPKARAALAEDYCGIVEVNEEGFKAEGERG